MTLLVTTHCCRLFKNCDRVLSIRSPIWDALFLQAIRELVICERKVGELADGISAFLNRRCVTNGSKPVRCWLVPRALHGLGYLGGHRYVTLGIHHAIDCESSNIGIPLRRRYFVVELLNC